MKLKGVDKNFWWNFDHITDSRHIPTELPGFTSIDAEVDDEYLAILFSAVKTIGSIYLKETQITDEGVKSLSSVRQLRHLTVMKHPGITCESLPYINQLTDLEYLDVWRTGIILEDIRELSQLKKLKELYVSATRVDEDGNYPEMEREKILEHVIELEDIFPGCAVYVDFDRF